MSLKSALTRGSVPLFFYSTIDLRNHVSCSLDCPVKGFLSSALMFRKMILKASTKVFGWEEGGKIRNSRGSLEGGIRDDFRFLHL